MPIGGINVSPFPSLPPPPPPQPKTKTDRSRKAQRRTLNRFIAYASFEVNDDKSKDRPSILRGLNFLTLDFFGCQQDWIELYFDRRGMKVKS
jgi:hypothetical protein